MAAQTRKNHKKLQKFLFENDELLKKILLSKKFLKLIKEYAVLMHAEYAYFKILLSYVSLLVINLFRNDSIFVCSDS